MTTITQEAMRAAADCLPLPSLDGLSEHQVRGITCVWDGVALTAETAVNLGPRPIERAGSVSQWFPRGCRPCTAAAAYKALLDHAPKCEPCRGGVDDCQTGATLMRLSLRGRRP